MVGSNSCINQSADRRIIVWDEEDCRTRTGSTGRAGHRRLGPGRPLDAGATSIPGVPWLIRQPQPIRVAVELVVGVPIAFGVALYVILETMDLLWFPGADPEVFSPRCAEGITSRRV